MKHQKFSGAFGSGLHETELKKMPPGPHGKKEAGVLRWEEMHSEKPRMGKPALYLGGVGCLGKGLLGNDLTVSHAVNTGQTKSLPNFRF